MQFLDHIRRGTSINMMDLAPGPIPADLAEALKVCFCFTLTPTADASFNFCQCTT